MIELTTRIFNIIKEKSLMFQTDPKLPTFSDVIGFNSSLGPLRVINLTVIDVFLYSGSQTGRKERYRRKMWVSFSITWSSVVLGGTYIHDTQVQKQAVNKYRTVTHNSF